MATKRKDGIFCLETASWDDEGSDLVKSQDSYDHFLRFLETSWAEIPYLHFDVATKAEFKFFLDKWKERKIQGRFPVLLLAFHGDQEGLGVIKDDAVLSTGEMLKHLTSNRYNDAIIHISSCYPLKDVNVKKLLYQTGALSVSGYTKKEGVDWYTPVALELLYLTELFAFESKSGKIGPPQSSVDMRDFVDGHLIANKQIKDLGKALGFHLWYAIDDRRINTDEHLDYIVTPCPVKGAEGLEEEHS